MILRSLYTFPSIRNLYIKKSKKWIDKKILFIVKHIPSTSTVIDIGSGNGLVCWALQKLSYNITPIDIKDLSIISSITPIIYDGEKIPFPNKTFDYAIISTVLHHSKDPQALLKEAIRIADRLVIIEDTYTNSLQKWVTWLLDWIVNIGYSPMTFKNKSITEWEDIFKNLNLIIVAKSHKKLLFFFKQSSYELKTNN